MSFQHTILGLLNFESLSGYEIKKIVEKTPFMYWSANNNQIYKSLAELLDEGFVTKEVLHQEGSPSKNVYTITDEGLVELNNWMCSATEPPVLRRQILIKLAFASHLTRDEVESLLESYARIVRMEMVLSERNLAQSYFSELAPEQTVFLELIKENMANLYSSELAWIQSVRQAAAVLPVRVRKAQEVEKQDLEVRKAMNYQLKEIDKNKYLYITCDDTLINDEQDALDIVAQCATHDTNAVVLDGQLSEHFFRLSTGLAGAVLQKFGNYNIRMAVVLHEVPDTSVRFKEMMLEQTAGSMFRIFDNVDDATRWLFPQ